MSFQVEMGNEVIGVMSRDGKVHYDKDRIREIIAGQATAGASKSGMFQTSVRVVYRYDRSREANNDAIYTLWKENPLMKNRIVQLNSMVFGRGFSYSYDANTQAIIDRFWKLNRLSSRLNSMLTDCQLYGETFIGLFPQKTGDILMAVYESDNVEVDFDPSNVDIINQYIVSYRDEEKNQDMQLTFKPAYQYINDLEFGSPINKTITKIKNTLGMGKTAIGGGFDGLMIHVKFNNSSSEPHGTSDFRQVYGPLNDYMDFRADRMTIHQLYGSPMFDITIDTDDPEVIANRIDELAGFTIGSNPVHNKSEEWKPLEFTGTSDSAQYDEKAMRGILCAGMTMPEHLLFNQSIGKESEDGAFALAKVAENMQDAFCEAFVEMHKVAVVFAGGDMTAVDQGEMVFPEISTMSEKTKAETYVLKVGAQICSRETASYNTGHNWKLEESKILDEQQRFGAVAQTTAGGGIMGGRFSSQVNNQDPNADHGTQDRIDRSNTQNITTQTFGSRKQNN